MDHNEPSGASPPMVSLQLLGGFRAQRAGSPIAESAWERRSGKALIKLLALTPEHRLHRDQILDALWPDLPVLAAQRALRKALHLARRALEPKGERASARYVQFHDDLVWITPCTVSVDIDVFERLAKEALRRPTTETCQYAVTSYTGDLLPEDQYEEWTLLRREALAGYYRQVRRQLSVCLADNGEIVAAAQELEAVYAQDPEQEEVLRELMGLYARGGRKHQALRQYQLCRARLEAELGVAPEPETTALYEAIRAAGPEEHRELATVILPPALQHRSTGPFIGREVAMHVVQAALQQTVDGEGKFVAVSGEAGVGKSRLLAEVSRQAIKAGALVLWGASYQPEAAIPYGLFTDAVNGYVTTETPEARAVISTRYPELVHLIPALGARGDDVANQPSSRQQESPWVFTSMIRLLGELEETRPVALLLDDLHAADIDSLRLLQAIVRSLPGRRWLVVGAYRREGVTPHSPLGELVSRAIREERAQTLGLLRLAQENSDQLIATLLGGVVAPDLLKDIYGRSLGNPLFLREILQTMQLRGEIVSQDGQWRRSGDIVPAAPESIQDLVQARVLDLGADAQQVLAVAAIVGMESAFSVLRCATGLPEDRLLDVLDRALEVGLLEEVGEGYVFSHPLIRAALVDRLSRQRQRYLHRQVAMAIEQVQPAEVEMLAHQYSAGGEDEKVPFFLEQAADRARAVYANETAVLRYQELIGRLERLRRADDTLRVSEKLGCVLVELARYDDAILVLDRVATEHRTRGDRAAEGRLVAHIGRAHSYRGTQAEGITRIQTMLVQMEREGSTIPSDILALLYVHLSQLLFSAGHYGDCIAAAQRGAVLAQQGDDMRAFAQAESRRGSALMLLGEHEEGRSTLQGVIPLAEAMDDLTTLRLVFHNLAVGYHAEGKFILSRQYFERALTVAERVGDPVRTAFLTANLADVLFLLGDWQTAQEYAQRAVATMRAMQHSWYSPYPLLERGQLALTMGDIDAAASDLGEAVAGAERTQTMQVLRLAQALLGQLDIMRGRAADVPVRLEPLLEAEGPQTTMLFTVLAQAHLALGSIERARTMADAGIEVAQREQNRADLADALRVRGVVSAQQGEYNEAERFFGEAVALARDMPYPYAEAQVLYEWGRVHQAAGDAMDAHECLTEAQRIFRLLGALPWVKRSQDALEELTRSV